MISKLISRARRRRSSDVAAIAIEYVLVLGGIALIGVVIAALMLPKAAAFVTDVRFSDETPTPPPTDPPSAQPVDLLTATWTCRQDGTTERVDLGKVTHPSPLQGGELVIEAVSEGEVVGETRTAVDFTEPIYKPTRDEYGYVSGVTASLAIPHSQDLLTDYRVYHEVNGERGKVADGDFTYCYTHPSVEPEVTDLDVSLSCSINEEGYSVIDNFRVNSFNYNGSADRDGFAYEISMQPATWGYEHVTRERSFTSEHRMQDGNFLFLRITPVQHHEYMNGPFEDDVTFGAAFVKAFHCEDGTPGQSAPRPSDGDGNGNDDSNGPAPEAVTIESASYNCIVNEYDSTVSMDRVNHRGEIDRDGVIIAQLMLPDTEYRDEHAWGLGTIEDTYPGARDGFFTTATNLSMTFETLSPSTNVVLEAYNDTGWNTRSEPTPLYEGRFDGLCS